MGRQPLEGSEFTRAVASKLNEIRAEQEMSLRDLDALSGVNYARLSRIFNGERVMTVSELDQICDALEVVAWQVVRDVGENLSE